MESTTGHLKLYLGCGPGLPHQQHLDVMGNWRDWVFVDKYISPQDIPAGVNFKKWDAVQLDEVSSATVEHIYSSHLLEHLPHTQIPDILKTWYDKLIPGGQITLNVPDLRWAALQVINFVNGQLLAGYFNEFDGEHGLLSVIYGSQAHEGEVHRSGFVLPYLKKLLQDVGFRDVDVRQVYESHEMGCLIATAQK